VVLDAGEQVVEVGAGELPVERRAGGLPVVLEGDDAVGDGVEVVEVVGGQDLALDDREVDLDLVEPRCVDGQVHELAVGQALAIRSMEAWPRCEEPLSATKNTRRAEA
jgi:hypothetical protein